MIQTDIRKLAQYGVKTGLVPEEDRIYTINRLLELFELDELEEISGEQAAEIAETETEELEQILTTLRPYKGEGRLITLFGCAGDRDRTKRAAMGEIVARLSDLVILTSDNPRTEDEGQIIDDTRPGLEKYKTPYRIIPDRYEAIVWALEQAQKDDILLLAGKGHEDYQVLREETIYFDEKVLVQQLLERQGDE